MVCLGVCMFFFHIILKVMRHDFYLQSRSMFSHVNFLAWQNTLPSKQSNVLKKLQTTTKASNKKAGIILQTIIVFNLFISVVHIYCYATTPTPATITKNQKKILSIFQFHAHFSTLSLKRKRKRGEEIYKATLAFCLNRIRMSGRLSLGWLFTAIILTFGFLRVLSLCYIQFMTTWCLHFTLSWQQTLDTSAVLYIGCFVFELIFYYHIELVYYKLSVY